MSFSAIISNLAGQAVTVNSITPTAYYGASLPEAAHTAQTPCRVIFSANPFGKGAEGDFAAIGKLTSVVFQLSDVLLWRPLTQGVGRAETEQHLIEYIDNYNSMLKTWRNAGQSAAVVQSWSITPGAIEYPEGSGAFYWGVVAALSIIEYYG